MGNANDLNLNKFLSNIIDHAVVSNSIRPIIFKLAFQALPEMRIKSKLCNCLRHAKPHNLRKFHELFFSDRSKNDPVFSHGISP